MEDARRSGGHAGAGQAEGDRPVACSIIRDSACAECGKELWKGQLLRMEKGSSEGRVDPLGQLHHATGRGATSGPRGRRGGVRGRGRGGIPGVGLSRPPRRELAVFHTFCSWSHPECMVP